MDEAQPAVPRAAPRTLVRAAVAVLLLSVGPAPAPAQEETDADSYRLRGASVAVHNIAGRTEIVRGDGESVRVEVTRRGADASRLSVATGVLDGRQTLRVVYPEDRVVYPEGSGGADLPGFLRWFGVDSESQVEVREDGRLGEDGREVEVVASGEGLRAWADLRIHVPAGQQLSLRAGVGRVSVRDVEGTVAVDLGSGPVEARGVRGTARLTTGSGSVRAASVEGELGADTGSGGVDLRDVSGDRIRVETGSGSVDGEDLSADRVTVNTGSGGIDLARVRARRLSLDTGSGSVELELLSDLDRGMIDTGSGGVEVTVPGDFGARLELDTGSGGIDVELAARDVRRDDDRWTGVVGDGRGSLEVNTGSGSIEVRSR